MAAAEVDEWETDEETDIVVKLSGVIRDEFIKNLSNTNEPKCSALGLCTEEPLIQLGTDLFKGGYSHPAGTHLILKDSQTKEGGLTYLTCTDKQLDMNKLYVQEKSKMDEIVESSMDISEEADVSLRSPVGNATEK